MINAQIRKNISLGDKIACSLVLYNVALKYQTHINLECCFDTKCIIDNLNLGSVFSIKIKSFYKGNSSIQSVVKSLSRSNVRFLYSNFFSLDKTFFVNDIVLPYSEIQSREFMAKIRKIKLKAFAPRIG